MRERRSILLILISMLAAIPLLGSAAANAIAVEPEQFHLGYPLVITLLISIALLVGFIEYIVVYLWKARHVSKKWSHILLAFLGVNLITFPLTQVVGFWIGRSLGSPAELIAEVIPLLLEPVMFIYIFRFLLKKGSISRTFKEKTMWKMIVAANLVTFILGLIGVAIAMNV